MRLVATPDAREDHAIGVEHRDSPLAKCQRPVEGSLARRGLAIFLQIHSTLNFSEILQ